MPEAILIQNTDSSAVTSVTSTDVPITSVNIKPCTYDNIRFDSTVQIATTGTSGTGGVILKLKFLPNNSATPVTLTTWNFKTDAVLRVINQQLSYIGNVYQGFSLSGGGVLTLAVNATTDAQTQYTAVNLYITSVE